MTYPIKDDSLVCKGLLQGRHWPFNLTTDQNHVGFNKDSHLTPLCIGRENEYLGQFMGDNDTCYQSDLHRRARRCSELH